MRGGVGRWLRTLRHMRAAQMVGQVRHRLRGIRPVAFRGETPRLAVFDPPVPFLEAPPHAAYVPDGRVVRLLNREVRFGEAIDWDYRDGGPLFAYHLHQFDYLRETHLTPDTRLDCIRDWIARHRQGTGWEGHPLSLRTLTWIKLLLTRGALPADAAAREEIVRSLADQIETLAGHLETHLLANHYFTNLASVVAAGLAFEGPAAARWLGHWDAFRAQLEEQVLSDGGHCERSPMYHALLLEQVLDLLNLSLARGSDHAEVLRASASRMLTALRTWTHPDGEIALFADSALGLAQVPAALHAYAEALGVTEAPLSATGVLDASGYVRLEAAPFCLIASVAGPSPAYQPGHAHGDALSFELSIDGRRVVTDTGVTEYVPGLLRNQSRATRSHATIEIDACDQAELWAPHRIGGRPRVALDSVEPGSSFRAHCIGWATPGVVHRRRVTLDSDADAVVVEDAVEGAACDVRMCLPLAPGLDPRLDGNRATLALNADANCEVELAASLAWSVEWLPYFPEFGLAVDRRALVGTGRGPLTATLRFTLR